MTGEVIIMNYWLWGAKTDATLGTGKLPQRWQHGSSRSASWHRAKNRGVLRTVFHDDVKQKCIFIDSIGLNPLSGFSPKDQGLN
jgi:hypothetical protein